MLVLRLGPNISIYILRLSPEMQALPSRYGIYSFLDSLNIDMIYRKEEMANYKSCL